MYLNVVWSEQLEQSEEYMPNVQPYTRGHVYLVISSHGKCGSPLYPAFYSRFIYSFRLSMVKMVLEAVITFAMSDRPCTCNGQIATVYLQ